MRAGAIARGLTLSASVAAVLVAAPTAQAATIQAVYYSPDPSYLYQADPGEANDLHLSVDLQTSSMVLRDPGVTMRAGDDFARERCVLSSGLGVCRDPTQIMEVRLGDRDDAVALEGGSENTIWSVDGGSGADKLRGSAFTDAFRGGAGGDDFGGGAGKDWVYYDAQTGPVHVKIDGVANDGEAGEKDNVRSDVEVVFGSPADDVLVGNGSSNTFDGYTGDDQLNGGAGADVLDGGFGSDYVKGGSGRDILLADTSGDVIEARDGEVDTIRCNGSRPTLHIDPDDVLDDCPQG
jgi:Ca2+-binding RTX toxin-like protein